MDEFVRRPKRSPLDDAAPQPQHKAARAPHHSGELPIPVDGPDPFIPKALAAHASKRRLHFRLPKPKTKVQWGIMLGSIAGLLLGTGFCVYYFILRDTTPAPMPVVQQAAAPAAAPEPTTIASRVSGRQLDKASAVKSIYAVQIENSPEARPQSGLKEADIISEAVAEGGITRFNAIFHDNAPANIGPIRSLRPYYIDWFLPYGAPIVHAGGSPEALSDVRALGIQDMDNTAGYFRRVSNRYAPHNLYSSGSQLLELFSKRGYKNTDTVPSLPRKDAAASAAPNAGNINLAISSALYNVNFTWDAASNTYLRKQGGAAHVDAETGAQLAPNAVVVPVMSKGIHPDRVHTQYGTVGSGEVFVFQDGTVTKGTWTKSARAAQWQLTDSAGAAIKLNPGQTWFTMIDSAGKVTFQ